MYAWAYGTIYRCRQEMDIYLSLLPAVFAVIPVLYTLLLRVPLVIESLLDSLLERAALREG